MNKSYCRCTLCREVRIGEENIYITHDVAELTYVDRQAYVKFEGMFRLVKDSTNVKDLLHALSLGLPEILDLIDLDTVMVRCNG